MSSFGAAAMGSPLPAISGDKAEETMTRAEIAQDLYDLFWTEE